MKDSKPKCTELGANVWTEEKINLVCQGATCALMRIDMILNSVPKYKKLKTVQDLIANFLSGLSEEEKNQLRLEAAELFAQQLKMKSEHDT